MRGRMQGEVARERRGAMRARNPERLTRKRVEVIRAMAEVLLEMAFEDMEVLTDANLEAVKAWAEGELAKRDREYERVHGKKRGVVPGPKAFSLGKSLTLVLRELRGGRK